MGYHRLIYIRTDGNSKIATGHLVRCLSIADACLSLGMKVCFLVSDEESKGLLQDFLSGMTLSNAPQSLSSEDSAQPNPMIRVLKTAVYNDLEKELTEVTDLIAKHVTNVIIRKPVYFLDSYYVTEKYLTTIKAYAKTAYLDDLQLFDYPVDLLVNYDVIPAASLPDYQKAYQNAKELLLGASYTPLRKLFQNRIALPRKCVSNVLVTTGGSDPYHFCLKLIAAFQEKFSCPSGNYNDTNVATLEFSVVIGKLNKDRDVLNRLAGTLPFIRLYENVSDMAALMASCDLAISAAGTTLYELCAVGVPAISFTMADNQIISAKAFADVGAVPYAGDIRKNDGDVINSVLDFVTSMSNNFKKRQSAHECMNRFVDGSGALRIARALLEGSSSIDKNNLQ